jgi:hypothetical protein
MRKRDYKAALVGGALALLLSGGMAWAATIPGDAGVIQACADSGGNVKVVPALPCPKGYTALGPIYTKAGADAAFLTQATADSAYLGRNETAADSDKLDGKDSSDFMASTNCVGYPRSFIDWHGCPLGYANLREAGLIGANLDHTNLFRANLHGALLSEATFVGARVREADLSSATLVYARLDGGFFDYANFENADLTGATLTGAILSGANLAGVTWSRTGCPDGSNSDDNGGTCIGHL